MDIRRDNFVEIVDDVHHLKESEPYLYDKLYSYQVASKNEAYIESMLVTKEFRDGRMDPTRLNWKYDKQMGQKKLQNMMA